MTLIYKLKLKDIPYEILNKNMFLLLMIPLFTAVSLFIDLLIKRKMFSIFQLKTKAFNLYKELFKGTYFGFLMPSIVGGDAYYIYKFGKNYKSYLKISSGILLIKSIGLIVFLVLAGVAIFLNREAILDIVLLKIKIPHVQILYLLFVALIMFILFLLFNKNLIYIAKIKSKIEIVWKDIWHDKTIIADIFLLTLIFHIFSLGSRIIIAKCLGIDLPLIKLAGIILIVNFLLLIPITFSGIGLREISYISLLGFFGISPEEAFLMSLFDFMISLAGVFIGGILVFYDNSFKKCENGKSFG